MICDQIIRKVGMVPNHRQFFFFVGQSEFLLELFQYVCHSYWLSTGDSCVWNTLFYDNVYFVKRIYVFMLLVEIPFREHTNTFKTRSGKKYPTTKIKFFLVVWYQEAWINKHQKWINDLKKVFTCFVRTDKFLSLIISNDGYCLKYESPFLILKSFGHRR